MADPTRSELITMLKNAVALPESVRDYTVVNSVNFLALRTTANDSLNGQYTTQERAVITNFSTSLASLQAGAVSSSLITPILRNFGLYVLPTASTEPSTLLGYLYLNLHHAGDTVRSRNITFGSPSYGSSNVGNGKLHRLTIDQYGHPIENDWAETRIYTCVQDANNGTQLHNERFQVVGEPGEPDGLNSSGSGLLTTIQAVSEVQTATYISNPSWTSVAATAGVISDIDSWEIASGSLSNIVASGAYYRDILQLDPNQTQFSIQFNDDAGIEQDLTFRTTAFNASIPMYSQLAIKRVDSASGTVSLQIGSKISYKTIESISNNSWDLLVWQDAASGCWFNNFNTTPLKVTINVNFTAGNAGAVIIDDLILVQRNLLRGGFTSAAPEPVPAAGVWSTIVGGSTAFLTKDSIQTIDSDTGHGKIQRQVWRGFGGYLPSSNSPTITDPTTS